MSTTRNAPNPQVGDMRICYVCKAPIAVTERMIKSKKYACPNCLYQRALDWRKRNPEKARQYSRDAHAAFSPEQRKKYRRSYYAANPEKLKAHKAVSDALRRGKLERKPCEVCGANNRIHAHHDDYSKKLDVIWLCHILHMERHYTLIIPANPPNRVVQP